MADQEDSDSEVNFNVNHPGRDDEDDERRDEGDHAYVHRERYVRRQVPNIRPDPYSGEEDWNQYLAYFEDCAELAQWSDKERLLYLATSLKGQARLHYSSLAAHERRSYRVLTAHLEQRFGSKRQAARWLSKIQNRTRQKNETVAEFGDEIRLYAQKAYVSLDPDAQEMLALEHFYKSFSPEMRCRLMDRSCRSISEAVEIVERYEDVLGRTNTSAGTIRGVVNERGRSLHEGPTESPDALDFRYVKGAIQKIETRLDRLEATSRRAASDKTCFTCGASDHFYRSCPNRHKQLNKPPQRNQENFKPSSR